MSAQSLDLQAKLAIWRQKAVAGTLSLEEMREAVRAIRGDRKIAASVSEVSRAKKNQLKAAIPSADDMLDELGGPSK